MKLDDYEEYMLSQKSENDDKAAQPVPTASSGKSLLPFLLFGLIGLPVLGIYMCFLPNKSLRICGIILIVLGIFLWCNKVFV